MADADRAINEILGQDNLQENHFRRISHYERVKAELMDTLKKIDEEEESASKEMKETYEKQ